ncbi:MAG: hypothetical protein WC907_08265 [Acholeplasmataceae bacterium]
MGVAANLSQNLRGTERNGIQNLHHSRLCMAKDRVFQDYQGQTGSYRPGTPDRIHGETDPAAKTPDRRTGITESMK